MNKRIRQWLKAKRMLDKLDPDVMAMVPTDEPFAGCKQCAIFRRSKMAEMREKYGDELEIIFDEVRM